MSKRTLSTLASLFTSSNHSSRGPTEIQAKPLTALAALVQEREALARKRTIASVSWLPDVIRIRGSIVPNIVGPVLTITLWAVIVAGATRFFDLPLRLSNSVVPLLSVVVGLLLVFRNGSAYERYSEGRKDFTTLVSAARNLSRLVWIQVSLPSEAFSSGHDVPPAGGGKGKHVGPRERMTDAVLKKEKVRFIKLVNAFVVAVKHHLRGEPGTDFEDYKGVLPADFLRFEAIALSYQAMASTPLVGSPEQGERNKDVSTPSLLECQASAPPTPTLKSHSPFGRRFHRLSGVPASPPPAADERTPFVRKQPSDWMNSFGHEAPSGSVSLPLPLVIAHDLSRSLFAFKREGTLEVVGPAGLNAMQNLVQTMIDQMGAMERVVRTPLPPVFQVHLKQCVSLYLFSLPLVLVDDMGWLMVSVVSLVAFTLMGIEGIAAQVENPFGTDDNDLPLDLEVAELRVELEYIFNRLPEGMDDEDVFAV